MILKFYLIPTHFTAFRVTPLYHLNLKYAHKKSVVLILQFSFDLLRFSTTFISK